MNIVIANSNRLLDNIFENSEKNVTIVKSKDELGYSKLIKVNPDYIFFAHWSYFIPSQIYDKFNCVVFHMTDLPFGRGGSPLQNLISRKIYDTKISAIKVVEDFDAGPIYLKKDLNLYGSAEEIYLRAGKIIIQMIDEILTTNPKPVPQVGLPVTFKRRTPQMSDIGLIEKINDLFDYIRMLDAEGYPKAYLETEKLKFEFSRASIKSDNSILADVRISEK